MRWVAAIALTLTAIAAAGSPHVSLVPWKVLDRGAAVNAPLVLYWVPASRDELRRSELLTSSELTLFASQCVAMRVVRFDDDITLEKLQVEHELPVAVLVDADGHLLAEVAPRDGKLDIGAVEAMVRDELDRRATEAEELLDDARAKANDGETAAAIAMYRSVWEQRCVCPRQARHAQRALKKLKAR